MWKVDNKEIIEARVIYRNEKRWWLEPVYMAEVNVVFENLLEALLVAVSPKGFSSEQVHYGFSGTKK